MLPLDISHALTFEVQPPTFKRRTIPFFRWECSARGCVDFTPGKVCMREEVHHEHNMLWIPQVAWDITVLWDSKPPSKKCTILHPCVIFFNPECHFPSKTRMLRSQKISHSIHNLPPVWYFIYGRNVVTRAWYHMQPAVCFNDAFRVFGGIAICVNAHGSSENGR